MLKLLDARNSGQRPGVLPMLSFIALVLIGIVLFKPSMGQNVPFQGGPIMQTNTVYLIYWLPSGSQFDSSVSDGIGNYESLTARFFNDVPATTYYSIAGQYAGSCPSGQCFVQNSPGAVSVGGTFVDTRTYAHADGTAAAGTQTDPLLDADIQHEIQTVMKNNKWSDGINAEYFVYTATGIQECTGTPASGAMCTFFNPANMSGVIFCAYHSTFTDSGGHSAVYAYMADVTVGLGGCNGGITVAPNSQLISDQEVSVTAHEFFESVSDPLLNAWTNNGTEIGDLCNQTLGPLRPDGSDVTLNGHNYAVQQIWSNYTSACSMGLPSIQVTIGTGGDDLRGDSSASLTVLSPSSTSVQGFTLKTQTQAGWGNNTTNTQMFGFSSSIAPQIGSVAITLTSHSSGLESDDNWNIQNIAGTELDGAGNVLCTFSGSGTPLSRLSGQVPTFTMATPACEPAPPKTAFTSLGITIGTGNDDARSDTELTASLPGENAICLKPSNNADPDGTCANGGKARDQNGNKSWDNWSSSAQTFTLSTPATAAELNQITINLIEHNAGLESDDNWDIQSIFVTGFDASGNPTALLTLSIPRVSGNDNNCMARLRGSPNPSSVTYNLSASNPGGSNSSGGTFGPTPPGGCPQ
jgi:hypothetical protein